MLKEIRTKTFLIISILFLLIISGCSAFKEKRSSVKVLIVPKFENGELGGDFPGEAQLFYQKYTNNCKEAKIANMPEGAQFYFNKENGVGILITGTGKTLSGLSLMALLSDEHYDFSDAYIVSVGCAGGSVDETVFGDVVLTTAVCDFDVGYCAHDREKGDAKWYPIENFATSSFVTLDDSLCDKVYDLVKDCPLQTTSIAKEIQERSFGKDKLAHDNPIVMKGTSMTSDEYWKGDVGHEMAKNIANYYGCKNPYTVCEMEEIAVANAVNCFDMLDRLISFRVVVNMDMFLDNQTPEKLWSGNKDEDLFTSDSVESLDIFEPAMHNLFDVSSIVIDAILNNNF